MTPDRYYEYLTLPSGLRILYRNERSMVESCGLAINAGSRDESHEQLGLAHFVEHTIFKGTARRRSWHIINRMEAVGGELNAYTTKEETMVYSIFPAGNMTRAAELIFDLAANSLFPAAELEKEREVVADEINSYLDVPSEAVFDDFEDLIFAGSQLGHNILGTVETVSSFNSDDCRRYLHRFYTPANMVFFYCGPTPLSAVEKTISRLSVMLDDRAGSAGARRVPKPADPFSITREIGSHQAHTLIGARLPGMHEIDRQSLALLTNLLGGPGMNSRLNIALRERRGLVYSVDASTALFTDAGLFTTYFGCDPGDTMRCVKIVERELNDIAATPLTEKALDRAKKQFLGQLIVGSENREQATLGAARATLYYGHALPPAEVADRIKAVTPARLLAIAQQIAASPSRLTLN